MIPPAVVDEVARLLAAGELSQRRIARLLGISRTSVDAIANRRLAGPPPAREPERDDPPAGTPVRCPGCGGMVYPPCRLCYVRALKRRDRARAALRRRLQRPVPPAARPTCHPPADDEGTPRCHRPTEESP